MFFHRFYTLHCSFCRRNQILTQISIAIFRDWILNPNIGNIDSDCSVVVLSARKCRYRNFVSIKFIDGLPGHFFVLSYEGDILHMKYDFNKTEKQIELVGTNTRLLPMTLFKTSIRY